MSLQITLIWAGALIALCLYPFLVKGILKNGMEQNCATWILWVSLDVVALSSVIAQHGNWAILACYITGGSVIVGCLIRTKQFKMTWFEWIILAMVLFCIVAWYVSGPRAATIFSTIAVVISGLPQLKDSWLKPDKATAYIYLGYFFANLASFLGGKEWTIEDKFYPGMCTPLCLAIGLIALRKKISNNHSVL